MSIAKIVATEIRATDLFTARARMQRSDRLPDLQAEMLASLQVSRMLADDPQGAVRQLLAAACRLCGAGSAGVSLVRLNGAGQTIVHWEAVSGVLASHEGSDAPRDFSTCGLCLDAGTTIVVFRPERVFTYLREMPAILEVLIVPLSVNAPLGTLWLARHYGASGFCSDDARIVEQLAVQLISALQLLEQASEQRQAAAVLESYQRAQRNLLSHDLTEARRLRDCAEASLFMPTLLQTVSDSLRESFSPPSAAVKLRVACDPIALCPEDAMAIALLTNEAITNAYKHAFPDGAAGEIVVELRELSGDAILLQIVDTGIGMRSTGTRIGFGLKLIRMFAMQLQGTLIFAGLAGGTGTSVTLTMHRETLVFQPTLEDPDQSAPNHSTPNHSTPNHSTPNHSTQWAGSRRSDSFLTTA